MFFLADLLLVLPLDTYAPQNSDIHVRTQYNKESQNVRVDMCAHMETYCAHSIVIRYYNERRPDVLATTIEASNQNVIEIYAMTTMNTNTHSPAIYYWLFLAVSRSDSNDRPHREAVTAPDERTARQILTRQFVLSFAGRLPVQEAKHA
ncbi:host cell division inhibitor Icd-like protein [Rahnella inusitata]